MGDWIRWDGGECPVPRDELVDVKLRNGDFYLSILATSRSWRHMPTMYFERNYDIIEYRVAKEQSEPTGRKDDSKKWRFSLLPWDSVLEVIKVLEFGATKYAPNNWQKVDNANERYFNAAMRHLTAWWGGEKKDPETNLSHLAHATCCLLFLMWFDKEKK